MCEGWHLLRSDSLSIIKEQMPPGTSEKLHYHEKAQQLFYILSGEATFEIDNETITINQNESIHIPAKSIHRIINNFNEDLIFILISEPNTQSDRVNIES
ncbi:MAG: hypothetical protein A2046_15990 [Bacteroidetes bacterium GWA2_30_7]|nr:MAG: hypothetical protein A2046_15990 [Bacteroidetes bacterium GWA2_30_7]